MPPTDAAYHSWRAAHPDAFVLNVERTRRPAYMVLHRAGCLHIRKHTNPGAFTERQYVKVCADDVATLRAWTRANGRPDGSFSKRCRTCSPP